jgi:hypothetical protein
MKILHAILIVFLVLLCIGGETVLAQEAKGALLRGYRTGYSDGYMAGYRDSIERSARDFASHSDYAKANRVYRAEYGSIEDYRDGYQQGFENGYNTGYDRREFDSSLPANLTRRGVKTPAPSAAKKENKTPKSAPPVLQSVSSKNNQPPQPEPAASSESLYITQPTIIIPTNTEIVVEMLADVSTMDAREGDSFLAKVVAPNEIAGAMIEGRVSKIKKPGRVKGNAELQLTFSRIIVNEKRWANFNATVIEALPMRGSNIKAIDEEGVVQGKSSLKSDSVKVGAATGTGAVVGAVVGGPVGAAVGAAVGGAFGVGGVLVARGKDINLSQGQQLRVRTNFESQIR